MSTITIPAELVPLVRDGCYSDLQGAPRCGRRRARPSGRPPRRSSRVPAMVRSRRHPGARYKPATLRGYTVGLNKRVLPALGDRRLSDVLRRDVQDLADRMTAEGLSASTVQNTLDPLRVIYRRAIRREEVTIDPTEGLELRRPDGRRERIADPAEAGELIAALPEGERALWACAFYAGLRRGELRALRWEDVDLPGRVIHVCRGWDAIEGEQDTKSAAGNRRVPILDPLAAELIAHRARTGRAGERSCSGAPRQTRSTRKRCAATRSPHGAGGKPRTRTPAPGRR